jgi:hypothetical protein
MHQRALFEALLSLRNLKILSIKRLFTTCRLSFRRCKDSLFIDLIFIHAEILICITREVLSSWQALTSEEMMLLFLAQRCDACHGS